jgi:hypothetical protein
MPYAKVNPQAEQRLTHLAEKFRQIIRLLCIAHGRYRAVLAQLPATSSTCGLR